LWHPDIQQGERAKKQKMAREEEEGEQEWDETIIFGLVELHRERGAKARLSVLVPCMLMSVRQWKR